MMTEDMKLLQRLWDKDVTLWDGAKTDEAIADRLGWLDAVPWIEKHGTELQQWADQLVKKGQFDSLLLLGMGGSSLAAEVFYSIFGQSENYLSLTMLDSTSPAQISSLDLDWARTLVVVSSKSGGTVETADLMAYFYALMECQVPHPGHHFVAITDPDSGLARQAEELGFLRVFLNSPDIGGRYSALSYFGLVPAALMGVQISLLLDRIRSFVESSRVDSPESQSVIQLAQQMAAISEDGLNQLVLNLDDSVKSLAIWIEQLVAESTGKNGVGVLPVIGNRTDKSDTGSHSSLSNRSSRNVSVQGFGETHVSISLSSPDTAFRSDSDLSSGLSENQTLCLTMNNKYDLGKEFLRWELATALAASKMGINPFDQPNVEEAKKMTRKIIRENHTQTFDAVIETGAYQVEVLSDFPGSPVIDNHKSLKSNLGEWSGSSQYLAILAYLPMEKGVDAVLHCILEKLNSATGIRATLGYGPRYLHSTGQLHKGGPPAGCFVQIIDSGLQALPIPGRDYGFDGLNRAQADGDFTILAEKNLPIMRIRLKGDRLGALEILDGELE